ncbi:MAG: hypothetical protein HY075_06050 [Deltaproteobacteria bacterium]|nr:hypothetical protein [Deltaproteobacteria bacterium]
MGGFSTKAQFAMFLPATLALFARYNPRRSARLAFVAASAAALLLTTRYFAARGEYTKRFGLESLATNLSNPKTWLLVVLAAVPVLLAGKLAKKGKWRELFAVTAPSLMIAGFLAIFLQWSVNGYLLSIVGPVVGALAAFLLVSVPRAWLGRRELTIATTILAATSLCVSAYRSSAFFTILGDFGRVVRSEQLGSASEPDAVYYLSCSEGVGAMRHYLHRFRGLSRNFDYLSNLDARLVKKGRAYLIADTKLCPLGALRGEVVFAGSRPESFQIYRLTE